MALAPVMLPGPFMTEEHELLAQFTPDTPLLSTSHELLMTTVDFPMNQS